MMVSVEACKKLASSERDARVLNYQQHRRDQNLRLELLSRS